MTVDEMLRAAAADLTAEVRSELDVEAALDRVEAAPSVPRRSPRPRLAAAAAVLVVLAAATAVAVLTGDDDPRDTTSGPPTTVEPEIAGPAPGVSEGLDIVATPSRDLVDGQEVRVTVEGLPTDEVGVQVALVTCAGNAMDEAPSTRWCEGPRRPEPLAPVAGGVEGTIEVERILEPDDVPGIDCADEGVACAIGVTVDRRAPEGASEEPLGPQLVGIVGVDFAPVGERPDPTLTVSSTEDLVHGQLVTLEGEGYMGDLGMAAICAREVEPAMCVSTPMGDARWGEGLDAGDDGGFRAQVRLWRMVPWTEGRLIDCAEEACVLKVEGEDDRFAEVPIAFADDVPAPGVPVLEVSRTTGLRPGDPVTFTVRGLPAGLAVDVSACLLEGTDCGFSMLLGTMVADDDGVATFTVPATDPAAYGQTCVDPGVCGVAVGPATERGIDHDPMLGFSRPVPVRFAPP